ncbi:MAG: ribonuclease HII [Gammaproteobacteria bacterium]
MSRYTDQHGLPFFSDGPVVGVDEAGRGPLAGPVVAAAVMFPAGARLEGLGDSKLLSESVRLALVAGIRETAIGWAVAWADPAEIDVLNILRATMLAMRRAVERLPVRPKHVLVDGNCCPRLPCTVDAIVGGDATVPAISAASVLAKVARDEMMVRLDERYPGYGFSSHKGYPTRNHVGRLKVLGPTPVHRRSFRPVAELVRAP